MGMKEKTMTETTLFSHSLNTTQLEALIDNLKTNDIKVIGISARGTLEVEGEGEGVQAIIDAHDPDAPTTQESTHANARSTLAGYKGNNVDVMNMPDLSKVVRALMQLQDLADENGEVT